MKYSPIKYGTFFQEDSTEDFKLLDIHSLLVMQYLDVYFNELEFLNRENINTYVMSEVK